MTAELEPEWYVDWPLDGGCLQVLVRAPDLETAETMAYGKLVGQYPQLEVLMSGKPRVRQVGQA